MELGSENEQFGVFDFAKDKVLTLTLTLALTLAFALTLPLTLLPLTLLPLSITSSSYALLLSLLNPYTVG
jgi:hypothetical protein